MRQIEEMAQTELDHNVGRTCIANSVFARSGGASRGLARTAGLAAGLKGSKMVYNGVCTLYKSIKLFPQQFGLEAWW